MRSGSYACLPSVCVQNLPAALLSTVVWRLAGTAYHSFFDLLCELLFWFPAPFRSWYLFVTGLYTSFRPFLDCPHFLPYYSVILAIMTQSYCASLGLSFILSPNGLTWPLVFLLIGSCVPFCFSLGHHWPICFIWAFSSLLLTLHFHGLLLTLLGFLGPITSFSSLRFMDLPLTPYFLCLHYFWACTNPFSLFYIIYCPWVCYFSFSGLL